MCFKGRVSICVLKGAVQIFGHWLTSKQPATFHPCYSPSSHSLLRVEAAALSDGSSHLKEYAHLLPPNSQVLSYSVVILLQDLSWDGLNGLSKLNENYNYLDRDHSTSLDPFGLPSFHPVGTNFELNYMVNILNYFEGE